jgi:2-haloacid dehalogenase
MQLLVTAKPDLSEAMRLEPSESPACDMQTCGNSQRGQFGDTIPIHQRTHDFCAIGMLSPHYNSAHLSAIVSPRKEVSTTLNRREFVGLVGAGVVSLSSPSAVAAVPGPRIRAIAFDGLAVFDMTPVAAVAERVFPGRGAEMSALWRTRQFEYTWLRTIGWQYADFWKTTEEALAFACKSLKLELTKENSDRLMQTYLELKAWPDALPVLKELKVSGLRMAFLSNFTARMLDQCVKNSGLENIFEEHLSTDRVRVFKPAPEAYRMATTAFQLRKEEIAFAAFAGWDAAGAKWFGYPTFWVNRAHAAAEELGATPDDSGSDLNGLRQFVQARY